MNLRPYQTEDVKFLIKLNAAGIFNEQRTGKTPTAFKTLEQKNCQKNLMICTATSLYKQQEEYQAWLNKPCVVIAGTKNQIQKALDSWQYGAMISYGTLKETKKHAGLVQEILDANPDSIILDEAHKIKSRDAAITKAVFKLIKIPVRLALTGTPAPGKQYEIWSILHWLYPIHFKSYWKFIEEYFVTIQRTNHKTNRRYIDIGNFKSKQKELELQHILSRISVQRKRKDVMKWLPEQEPPENILLKPTKEQLKYLKELEKYFETGEVVTQGVLDRLIRYRQICQAPELLNLPGKSPKIEWLKQYLDDYPDRPTIIFSKFTSLLKIIQSKIAPNVPLIIGETPLKQRQRIINDFQNGKTKTLLLNIDTCKEAITLDTAEYAIFLDKYPPAGDISQAEDRFISTTPDKKDKVHVIINLILEGTYDEHLYKLVEQRLSETDVINDYKKYLKGGKTGD